jgi:Cellulose binding domain
VTLASFASGACATAVELDPRGFDSVDAGAPAPDRGNGGRGGDGADVRAPPSSGGWAGSAPEASILDRVQERTANDERMAVDRETALDERSNLDAAVSDTTLDVVTCTECMLRVQYRAGDTNATDNQMKPQFNVINRGNLSVPLVELTLRYWLTDPSASQMFFCDYAELGCSGIEGSFGTPPMLRPRADRYLEIGFTQGAGALAPGSETGEIQARCQKADYSPYQEADDYSFDPSTTAFADAPHVTLYRQGVLVWGVEP